MVRVLTGGAVLATLLAATPAWSQSKAADPVAQPPAPALEPSAPEPVAEPLDWARLASEFETLVQRYIRLVEFTRRIEAEREERDFEEAAARYARYEAFTRALEERRERELEREFEESVALHLRKRAFTLELVLERERAGTTSSAGSQ